MIYGYAITTNAFLTQVVWNGTNAAIGYSAVFGGTNFGVDIGYGVALDTNGDAFVVGAESSLDFPTTITTNTPGPLTATNSGAGASDVLITAFNTNGSALLYSACLGGLYNDYGYAIAVDSQANAYIVGQTYSFNFPTNNARQAALNGPANAFLAKIISFPVAPQITVQPTNQSAGVGSTVNLAVTATGTTPLIYQWQMQETNLAWTNLVNGGIFSGANSAILTLTGVQTNNSGNYWVIITNYAGAVTSSVAVLTVTNDQIVITEQPLSQTVGLGAQVVFSVNGPAPQPPYFFQWLKNTNNLTDGGRISGSATPNLYISDTQTNDDGAYQVVVSNAWSVLASSNAILTVLTAPLFSGIAANGTNGGFILDGVGGTNSGTYLVLISSNIATPFALWTPVATNQFDSLGQFVFTNIVPTNAPQLFFRLRSQ